VPKIASLADVMIGDSALVAPSITVTFRAA